mgnify:CR=1 FL=1
MSVGIRNNQPLVSIFSAKVSLNNPPNMCERENVTPMGIPMESSNAAPPKRSNLAVLILAKSVLRNSFLLIWLILMVVALYYYLKIIPNITIPIFNCLRFLNLRIFDSSFIDFKYSTSYIISLSALPFL